MAPKPWREIVDELLVPVCLDLNREPSQQSARRRRGQPNKPESTILPGAIDSIVEQEGVTEREASRRLLAHLINSPKLTDPDRAELNIPNPPVTRTQFNSGAERLRKGNAKRRASINFPAAR
jgi:hypothetical protein